MDGMTLDLAVALSHYSGHASSGRKQNTTKMLFHPQFRNCGVHLSFLPFWFLRRRIPARNGTERNGTDEKKEEEEERVRLIGR